MPPPHPLFQNGSVQKLAEQNVKQFDGRYTRGCHNFTAPAR